MQIKDRQVKIVRRVGSVPVPAARFPQFRESCPIAPSARRAVRRLAALSSTIKTRKSASLGWRVSRRGLRFGQKIRGEMKCRTFSRHALGPHFSTHQFHQPFADGQAQSRAAVMLRRRNVRLHERLEQPRQLVGRDADAGVLHGKMQMQRIRFGFIQRRRGKHFDPDGNIASVGEFDRVAEKIRQHLPQPERIAFDDAGMPSSI